MAISQVNLGKTLKKIRSKRFTQEEIAEAVGLSTTQVSKIECGHASIYLDKLDKWCELIGVSVVEVLSGADMARGEGRFAELTAGRSPEFTEKLLEICENIIQAVDIGGGEREEE